MDASYLGGGAPFLGLGSGYKLVKGLEGEKGGPGRE